MVNDGTEVGSLYVTVSLKSNLKDDQRRINSRLSQISDRLKQTAKMGAAAAGTATSAAVAYSIKSAAAHEQVAVGFEQMVQKHGKSVDTYLEQLQEASSGTISETELMRNANQALLMGLDTEQVVQMLENVTTIALNTGRDVNQLYAEITEAVGTMSVEQLENIGITLEQAKAEKLWAQRMDTTVDKLSATEKKTGFQTIALERLQKKAAEFDGVPETTQTSFQQLQSNLNDVAVEIGTEFLPAAQALADWAKNMSESGHIEDIAKALVTLGYSLKSTGQMAIFFVSTMRLDRAFKDYEGYVNDTKAALDAWMESGQNYRETMKRMSNEIEEQKNKVWDSGQMMNYWSDRMGIASNSQQDMANSASKATQEIQKQQQLTAKQSFMQKGGLISGSGEWVSPRELGMTPRESLKSQGAKPAQIEKMMGTDENKSTPEQGQEKQKPYQTTQNFEININGEFYGLENMNSVEEGLMEGLRQADAGANSTR